MIERVRCRCGKARLARFATDGNGGIIDVTPECECVARRRAGLCRRCPNAVAGKVGVSIYCAACKKVAQKEAHYRWIKNNPESYRAHLRKTAKARTARKRRWEKAESREAARRTSPRIAAREQPRAPTRLPAKVPHTARGRRHAVCRDSRRPERRDAQREYKRQYGRARQAVAA